MQRAEMDYYYSYPQYSTLDEGTRRPIQLSEAQLRASNTAPLQQNSLRLPAQHPDQEQRLNHDSKPRLSKEQQDILERHFQEQSKPSTTTKRGFADSLGVPLDKINNWFQNRRAKVKQDAKKQQGAANNLYHLRQPFDLQASEGSGAIGTTVFDPSYDPSPPQPLGDYLTKQKTNESIGAEKSPGAMNFTYDMPGDGSFQASNFAMNDSDAFNNFFGFDNNQGSRSDINYEAIAAFGRQFNSTLDTFTQYSGMPSHADAFETPNATAHTHSGQDESLYYINQATQGDPYNHLPSFSCDKSSSATSAQLSSADSCTSSPVWAESNRVAEHSGIVQQGQIMLHQMAQLPLRLAASKKAPTEQIAVPALPSQVPIDRPKTQTRDADNTPSHVLQVGASSHADVDLQQPTALKQSSTSTTPTSNLASRRQRRPAALGNLPRSTSYQGLAQISPPPVATTPDQGLRRIKSSMGLINGRVHKVPSSQKSPGLHLTFADAAASPRLLRKKSSLTIGARAAAPPTPSSPFRLDGSPEMQKPLWTPLQSTFDQSTWCSSPTVAGQAVSYASPPSTPFDANHHFVNGPPPHLTSPIGTSFAGPSSAHYLPSGISSNSTTPLGPPPPPPQLYMSNTPPTSQWLQVHGNPGVQSHSIPVPQPQQMVYAADPRMVSPNAHFTMGPPGVSSLPQQVAMVPMPMPPPHGYPIAYQMQPAYQIPMEYGYPFPPGSYVQQQQLQQQHQPQYAAFNTKANMNSGMRPPQELEIHEYSPREPVDPSVLPPKAKANGPPKSYIFTNQGPEHFTSP